MEVSRLTGKLSHRLSGIFAQLLVLRYPPCEAGGGGGCVGIPRPQLTTLKSAGEGGGGDPESLMERGQDGVTGTFPSSGGPGCPPNLGSGRPSCLDGINEEQKHLDLFGVTQERCFGVGGYGARLCEGELWAHDHAAAAGFGQDDRKLPTHQPLCNDYQE